MSEAVPRMPCAGLIFARSCPIRAHWTRFHFDVFTVDASQRHLYRLGSETPVDLPPRAFEALLQFVERPGELLTKKALMKALWPDVVVEENNLNQVISLLRRVLGERPVGTSLHRDRARPRLSFRRRGARRRISPRRLPCR